MALVREETTVIPVHGEWGRYTINSRSAAKKGQDEVYIVDVLEEHVHNDGEKAIGVCPCKGFQIRRKCSHLDDAREYHEKVATARQASELGFEHLPK
jgi:hypothetical protein